MFKKLRVGVIMGGRSGEHEVSLVSAASVIKALDKKRKREGSLCKAKDCCFCYLSKHTEISFI